MLSAPKAASVALEQGTEPALDAGRNERPREEKDEWFQREVHVHEGTLKSYLRGSFPAIDVEDVVQESYLRVWKARAAQPLRSAKAFLFTIAKRLALDALRHRRKSPVFVVPDLAKLNVIGEGRDGFQAAAIGEEIALLAEALETLPPRCREIIILCKFKQLPQREVAERLGIAEGTVEEQVYRGLRRVEKFFIKRGLIKSWHHE